MPAFLVWGFWSGLCPAWLVEPPSRSQAGQSSVRYCLRLSGRRTPWLVSVPSSASPSPSRPSPSRRSPCLSSSRASGLQQGPSGSARSDTRRHGTRRSRSGDGASTTRAGIPDLGFVQPARRGARRRARARRRRSYPKRKGPVELAALTAAVLVAFQLSLTHWFYLYLPWVAPVRARSGCSSRSAPEWTHGRRVDDATGSIADASPGARRRSR